MQEALRVSSKSKIQPLDARRVFLQWQDDNTTTKKQFRDLGVTDWADQVLRLAKDFLRIQHDIESYFYYAYIISLREFKSYIKAIYIVAMNLLTDLFSQLYRRA